MRRELARFEPEHTEERVDRGLKESGAACSAKNDQLRADTLVIRSDESLISLAKTGAHLAFAELCDRHKARAYRVAYRITRNREDAEDAIQESMLKALIHLRTFDGRSTFSTWFMRITMNSALMTLRKKRVRTYLSLEEEWLYPPQEPRPSSDPQLHLLHRESEELVRAAICRLPPTLRSVTEMRYSLDISLCEVAELEGISIAATKSRLMRARQFLHRTLSKTKKERLNRASLKQR